MMKRVSTFVLIPILLTLLLATGCGNGKGEPAKPTPTPTATAVQPTPTQTQSGTTAELPDTYQFSIAFADQANLSIDINVWVKGERMRSDYAITQPEEDTDTTIFIADGEFDWVYDPDEEQVSKYNPGAGANPAAFYSMWFESNYYGSATESEILSAMQASCTIDPLCESVEKTGDSSVDGEPCTIFAMTSTEGTVIEHCLSADGYPLMISLTDFGFTSTLTFTGIDLNPDISDDIFDIDKVAPGAEVIDNT
jgi:outer membrane lipoprotein-sorting protein